MVYEKYIIRGGKKYGPYLYHSTRKGDKVVTSYVKKDEVRKASNSHSYALMAFILLALTAFLFYQTFYNGLTGFSSHDLFKGKANLAPAVVESVAVPSQGKATLLEETVKVEVSRDSNPSVIAQLAPVVGEPVVLNEIQQSSVVNGQQVDWNLNVDFPSTLNENQVEFHLAGAKFVTIDRIDGSELTRASIKAKKFEGNPFDFLDIFDKSIGKTDGVTVTIKDPAQYLIKFSTAPAIVKEKKISKGKSLEIKNLGPGHVTNVVVDVSKEFNVRDASELSVFIRGGEKVSNLLSYDTNNDGRLDFVKFSHALSAKSTDTIDVLALGGGGIQTGQSENEVYLAPVSFEDLSEECKLGLDCGEAACDPSIGSVFSRGEEFLEGERTVVCTSENLVCPPVVSRTESCVIEKKRKVEIEVSDGFDLAPGETSAKEVLLRDQGTNELVGSISIADNNLEIIF
jgi:hypothetical protein